VKTLCEIDVSASSNRDGEKEIEKVVVFVLGLTGRYYSDDFEVLFDRLQSEDVSQTILQSEFMESLLFQWKSKEMEDEVYQLYRPN